jgi:hypothetical protein
MNSLVKLITFDYKTKLNFKQSKMVIRKLYDKKSDKNMVQNMLNL